MEAIRNSQITLIEAACLALISQGSTHGYDIAKRFHPDGDIGEIFTQTNPVVYRALKSLEAAHLVKSTDALGVRKQLKFALSMTEKVAAYWTVGSMLQQCISETYEQNF